MLASAYRDDDDEPRSSTCSGCRRRLRVAAPLKQNPSRRAENPPGSVPWPMAFSEDRDPFGRKRYWCRRCTEVLWRSALA